MPRKTKTVDKFIIGACLIAAPIITLVFKISLLYSIVLFYAIPSVWLSVRCPKLIVRTSFFAFLGTVIFFIVDYIAAVGNAWWVSTIFNFRFLGVLPIEDSLWFFFGVYLIVMFYEYFDDHGPHRFGHTKLRYLIAIILLLLIIFFLTYVLNPTYLIIHYAYLWIGIIFSLLPSVIILSVYRPLRTKFLKANLYMAAIHLPFELVALRLGQWNFPGNEFIGWVQMFGVRFPIEELLVYIATAGITLLAYYEFYDDDGK